jgi:N-acetylneuraminic acid mutarotase
VVTRQSHGGVSLCVFFAAIQFTQQLPAAPLTWFPGPTLNEPRSSMAAVSAPGGSILLFGGNPVGSTNVLVYGRANAQPIPSPRVAPGAVALLNGQFFVYGGKQTDTANSVTSSVLSYNPVASNVDDPNVFTVSSMSSRRYDMAYAADGSGYAYAIGGLGNNSTVLASVERYDPAADVWTQVASLPAARYHFAAVFDGINTIYAFGGRTNAAAGTETADLLAYDVIGDSWAALPSMPVATAGSAAILGADGMLYVIGGTAGGLVTNLVQTYDPGSGTWELSTPLPSAVTAAGGAVDALGRLVVLGGADDANSDLATTWVSQQLNVPDAAPAFLAPLPPTHANCLVPYTCTVQASGNPQPTYQLVAAPDGMQINQYNGQLTWTPQPIQFGTNVVTIAAVNYAGTTNLTFSINTVGPPLTAPTNLVVAGLTDTSVTLAWDPVPFVIGPLTYTVYQRTFVHSPRGSGGTYIYGAIAVTATNSVTIGGLAPGSTHTYVVKASAAGVASGYSQALAVVLQTPQPPVNFRVTVLTSTTTSLAWDPSPGPVPIAYYSVFEETPLYTLVPVATGVTDTFVTLTGLLPGMAHTYVVRAYDAAGNPSSFSYPSLVVYNPAPTPAALSSLTPAVGGGFQFTVQLQWAQTTYVQATTDPSEPSSWVTIATNLPTTTAFTFIDDSAATFPMRFYRVATP